MSPQRHYGGSQLHEDTKMSKSMKVRNTNADKSPFMAHHSSPMEQLKPVVR